MKFRYIAGILLAAIMAAATVFLAAGCDEDETVAATGVTLSETELSLTVGESATLTATVTPDNATDKSVTWTSSDPAVATVEGGEVTAVAEGGATITAACGEVSASVSCTVSAAQEPDRTTVTEAEWEAAFAEEKFENFRMTVDVFAMQDGEYIPVYTMEYVAADGKRYIAANGIGESAAFREETFEVYSETEIVKYSKQTDGSWGTTEQQYSGDRHNGIKGIPLSGWRALRGKYKDFTQPSADEEAYSGMVYVVGEGVDSGAAPTWNEYKVAFKNGVLSTVECMPAADSNSMEALKIAFTFGGQSIQLPETGPSAGSREEWDAAFSADKFENMKFEVRDLNGAQTPAMDYIVADGKEYLKRTGVRNSVPFTDEFYSLQTQTEYTQYYRDSKSQWKSRSSQNSLLIDEGEGFGDVLLAPLKDAYENFTYDDAQKCYVGKMDFGGELFDVKVVIENGMLSQISGTPEQCLITFTFGDQIVELPPEIGAIS